MIIPLPVQLQTFDGVFEIGEGISIAAAPDARSTAAYLVREIRTRTDVSPRVLDTAESTGTVTLRIDSGLTHLGAEGYALKVSPASIDLSAQEPAGLFYGVQTLLQMLDQEIAGGHGSQVPCVEIEDRPRYPWRGFMLDSSRHFQKVETVKRILDQMAYLKLNLLHWHLTDDQGWRVEIKRYPRLTEFGSRRLEDEPGANGFYTQDELRDIVAYAGERHITVMPEIEMPAHTAAAMACYPELTCSGEHGAPGDMGLHYFIEAGCTGGIYCAAREETYEFIEGVLAEVMDVFPSPVIHLGGDERPDGIWDKCPRCKALMEKEGLKNEMALQAHFMRRITDFVNKHGRRTMAWCTTTEFGVPENQIVEDWFYGTLADAARLGHDGISARDRFTYLDYPNFAGRQKPDWMPELWVDTMYEFNPTPEGLTAEQETHVLGGTTSLWTEFIDEGDLSEAMFPRMLAFAEVVWTPQDRRSYQGFNERMKGLEAPLARMGATYAVPPGAKPVKLARPATVTTSMDCDPAYPPECAFDGSYVWSFMTATNPKAGDHLTVRLDKAEVLTRIVLYTGTDFVAGTTLPEGAIEVSRDGREFTKIADVSGQRTIANLSSEATKAVRVVVTKDMDHRLAIAEIVLQ